MKISIIGDTKIFTDGVYRIHYTGHDSAANIEYNKMQKQGYTVKMTRDSEYSFIVWIKVE